MLSLVRRALPRPQPLGGALAAAARGRWLSSVAPTPFKLADIGEGISEVEITEWFVKVGDKIDEFDRLCEVQSDKATVEITSPHECTIQSLEYAVGDMAKVGTPLLHMVIEGEDAPAAAPAAAAAAAVPAAAASSGAPSAAAAATGGKVLATPATRHMAKQHNLDLGTVAGTGRDGRVTKEDVLAYMSGAAPAVAAAAPAVAAAAPAAAAPAAPAAAPAAPLPAATLKSVAPLAEDRIEPIKGIRKAMFAQMTAALSVPSFGFADEVCMDELMALRKVLKPMAAAHGVPNFTLMPLLVKATSLALSEHPLLNSQISADGKQLAYKAAHNIGVAMDTPSGLLVPNIKNVQQRTLLSIALELARLAADAKAGKLQPADLKGGTFTLSNIGNLGGTYTGPVINLPEVAIAGMGKIRPTPRYNAEGELVKEAVMQISWSGDHRVIDGAAMARFSNSWIGYLETPGTMLLHL
jgi:2-oxoisovalerate dehydrogenase E2 component (dihydrolipoyl transacylase)